MSDRLKNGRGGEVQRQRWARARMALLGVAFVVALTVLLIFPLLPTGQVTYQVGDVARADIRAPRRLEYISQIETERAKELAAASVEEVYDPPETRVARRQVARAQEILSYITSVREDVHATPTQRVAWVQAIPDPELNSILMSGKIRQILDLSDVQWTKVRDEVVRVLVLAMRASIREGEVAGARADVPTLVDVQRMNDQEVAVVSSLVQGLLVPNTFVNTAETEADRQAARDRVGPVPNEYNKGEIVLREGDTITKLDLEALQAMGLLQHDIDWRDVGAALTLVSLTTVVLGLALARYQPGLLAGRTRNVALAAFLFVAFVVMGNLMVPGRAVLSYMFPASALSMLVTVLLNPELALIASLMLAGLVGHLGTSSLELATYTVAGGVIAALVLRRVERVNAFFRAGVYVGLTNVAVVFIFRLPGGETDPIGLLTLVTVGLGNGALAASLTLAVFFVVGSLFDVVTALQLLELAQPSHPLQHRLLTRAPGTYHHTLIVSNLAEQAAEYIGANALLTRVGAFYHDIGKTMRPHFFTENQIESLNPHDRLDPYASAEIVRSHVLDGLELAKRHRLPSQVRAFISEHHGDALVSFFYHQAVEAAGGDASKVDKHLFRYVGPKPQSRETALLMLADTSEAIVKSKRPSSVAELEALVDKAIKIRMDQGQLNECNLTLHDLQLVRQSFVDTLKGLYHTRIEYPEPKASAPASNQAGAPAPVEETRETIARASRSAS